MPFILAPAKGCWVGLRPITWAFGPSFRPSAHHSCFRPIPLALGEIIIQSMDDLDRLHGRYPEYFVLISQLKVCQEGGGQEGGYLEDDEGS